MSKYVSDTMAVVLYLEKRKMPEKTRQIFAEVEQGEHEIYIPSMVLAEIGYLSEKGRIETTLQALEQKINRFSNITAVPMDLELLKISFQIDDIPELHDRIIAGAAKYLGLEIITNDPAMENSSHVTTIWK